MKQNRQKVNETWSRVDIDPSIDISTVSFQGWSSCLVAPPLGEDGDPSVYPRHGKQPYGENVRGGGWYSMWKKTSWISKEVLFALDMWFFLRWCAWPTKILHTSNGRHSLLGGAAGGRNPGHPHLHRGGHAISQVAQKGCYAHLPHTRRSLEREMGAILECEMLVRGM